MKIKIRGSRLFDEFGRQVLWRGVNVGGSSKVPSQPDGATWRREHFFEHRDVSFVGRPFALDEADEHFERLRAWGLHFLRWVIPWEALEHDGPGQYDEHYLDYLYKVIKKAGDYGMSIWIDPHQDVWSRWTGGDGAPGWTLESVGFDLTRMQQTGAAVVHNLHGDPLPTMIWPTNHDKLGTATMFSLFFAGHDLAPHTQIEGEPVQEFLQRHFIQAMQQVARRLQGLSHVVGYGTWNEPGRGWIGLNLQESPPSMLRKGPTPTPWQAILLGAGYSQSVDILEPGPDGPEKVGETLVNPEGVSVWREGYVCPWKHNGVWDDRTGSPVLLCPQHFSHVRGVAVDFANDYLKPFLLRYIEQMREPAPQTIVFLEGIPFAKPPQWTEDDPKQVIHGVHWYDGVPLVMKVYQPEFTFDAIHKTMVMGAEEVRQSYMQQLSFLQTETREWMNDIPVCVGEFGLPFDLDNKHAYRSGDFGSHIQALDAYFCAMETLFLSCTLWNYTADNSNERGDQWNDEDLSIYSVDQRGDSDSLHAGGRALQAIVRPYPKAIAGQSATFAFDIHTREFKMSFMHGDGSHPTEIFVPSWVYPDGIHVEISDGSFVYTPAHFLLQCFVSTQCQQHTLRITPKT